MNKLLEQKVEPDCKEVWLKLPISDSPALGHIRNINYCIEQIKRNSQNEEMAVGYILQRSFSLVETYHRLFPVWKAKQIRKASSRFNYHNLDDFLKKENEIKNGKYKLHRGLIIDINPDY